MESADSQPHIQVHSQTRLTVGETADVKTVQRRLHEVFKVFEDGILRATHVNMRIKRDSSALTPSHLRCGGPKASVKNEGLEALLRLELNRHVVRKVDDHLISRSEFLVRDGATARKDANCDARGAAGDGPR